MKLFVILGNQLFPLQYVQKYKEDCIFFISEDYKFCTYEKHNKKKILFFLSCMRSYCDELKEAGFRVNYQSINDKNFKIDYLEKIKKAIINNKIKEIVTFEIEDKPFENKFKKFIKKEKVAWTVLQSPMFINSRATFKEYINNSNKPLMKTFYKETRINLNILIEDGNAPTGGKWSFDNENRKKLPKSIKIPKQPEFKRTKHTLKLIDIINDQFKGHLGSTDNFWLATKRDDAIRLLDFFLEKKIELFGDYEDAVSSKDNVLFHSTLSPYINIGLITPHYIIKKTLDFHTKNNIRLNSLEGFIRQIIGWREFLRGIYQNYSKKMVSENFFNHRRRMKGSWYSGTTGLEPLDHTIKKAVNYGWSNHIERLMILANIMNLCEIEPKLVYKWFMEMYVDSSDWVMAPNIYSMGLFSDGGIFSTKPYISGSNYLLKMTDFNKGSWCLIMDGLYWRFINKNREFFLKNPRLSMMVRIFDKMEDKRKSTILKLAEIFIKKNTIQ